MSIRLEKEVAKCLADKEGLALKRQRAIEEEAEKKRQKKLAIEKIKSQIAAGAPPQEEKYNGPLLLNSTAPEMVVSSGALGMTSSEPSVSRPPPKKRRIETPQYSEDVKEDASIPSTSNFGDSSGNVNSEDERTLLRYKEIGRLICEIEVSDFAVDKSNDRKTFMIASRGKQILAAVRKNLGIFQKKLGHLAEGTIFEHVDELVDSFSMVSPNALSILNEKVSEKMWLRNSDEQMTSDNSEGLGDVKLEVLEREVKKEPVDVDFN